MRNQLVADILILSARQTYKENDCDQTHSSPEEVSPMCREGTDPHYDEVKPTEECIEHERISNAPSSVRLDSAKQMDATYDTRWYMRWREPMPLS